jgi:HK97 family phage prohead protease
MEGFKMGIKKFDKKIMHKVFAINCSEKEYDSSNPLNISGIANMASEDRMGDVILKDAWILDNYKKNPVVLFNHCYDNLVGKATSIEVTDNGLEISAEIGNPSMGYELTDTQKMVRSLLAQGILRAFSVGFMPLDAKYDETNEQFLITKAELLEVSLVTVPCQQESLISEVKTIQGKGEKKAMDEELKAALTEIANGVKACVEKIGEVAAKLESKGDDKPAEDKPEDEPTPVEEGLRSENAELKAKLSETETVLGELIAVMKGA